MEGKRGEKNRYTMDCFTLVNWQLIYFCRKKATFRRQKSLKMTGRCHYSYHTQIIMFFPPAGVLKWVKKCQLRDETPEAKTKETNSLRVVFSSILGDNIYCYVARAYLVIGNM